MLKARILLLTIVLFSILGGTAAAKVHKHRTLHLWFTNITISGEIRCHGSTFLAFTTIGTGATTIKAMSSIPLPFVCPTIIVKATI